MLDPIERMEEWERISALSWDELQAEVEADRRWRHLMRRAAQAERDEADYRDMVDTWHAQEPPEPEQYW